MMNKRRTSEMGKAKYLLFAPLAAALLMVSNIETVAREVSEQLPGNVTMQEKSSSSSVVANVALADSAKKAKQVVGAKKKAKQTQKYLKIKTGQILLPDGSVVYDIVEQMPQFPGGMGEFMKYVGTNIKYPKEAVAAKKQGTVLVSFVIEKDGRVSNPKVFQSVDANLDAEALRVVGTSPKWTPDTQDGKPVPVHYIVPIQFTIPASKDAEQK